MRRSDYIRIAILLAVVFLYAPYAISEVAAGSDKALFASGSVAASIAEDMDHRIAGKNFEKSSPLWSVRNDAKAIYVWNVNCWISGVNMSCVSPWNSTGSASRTVTLITPDAVIGAKHHNPGLWAEVRFVGLNGKCYSRKIVAVATPGSDIWIGRLDSPLPSSIVPAKCLPASHPTLPLPANGSSGAGIPVCGFNQSKRAIVFDFNFDSGGSVCIRPPEEPQRKAFYTPIIVGDSGSPFFLIIHNEPVILGCWWTSAGGPSVTFYQKAINAALASIGSKNEMETVDLTGN